MTITSFFSNYLLKSLPLIQTIQTNKFEICITVPVDKITHILFYLQKHTQSQYKVLTEICVIDFLTKHNRFEIVYNLLSLRYNSRIRIRVHCNELQKVPTSSFIFKNANWLEREIFDMFGIFFSNHLDLRRLLNDYGFEGYPLRKDFPLNGFLEIRYSELKKRIIYEPINLAQNYRKFNYESAW